MTRTERLMAVVLLLQERRRRCEEIAECLEVSRRTVMRDVQALYEMGVPIISQDGIGGGYSLPAGHKLEPLELSWQEALLLIMAVDSLSKMSDSPFSAERASLASKVRHLIPHKHLAKLEVLRQNVQLEVPKRQARAPMLDRLVGLVGASLWIQVSYDSEQGESKRVVRPDRLFAERGFWYLEATEEQGSRLLRVDRILEIDSAEPPASVEEPLPYGHPSHPLIRVRLTRRGARIVQGEPHLGGQIQEVGEQTLEFRCPPSEFDWYTSYFGGLSPDAEVLEPEDLRQRIRRRAQSTLDLYS
ncbi:MAG: WYL domain-containing protein [Fimbriimonas sp.]|nr:WYL domain-containing protein [Fimbriimonas sp.]